MTTQDQTASQTAEDQPQAGIDRTKDAPPVAPGMRRNYYDMPIKPEPPKPLADRLFSYAGGEASRFETFATELYAAIAPLVEANQRALGHFANDFDPEPTLPNKEAAFTTQAQIDAYYCALSNLRKAAEQLRALKLALSPYVDPETVKRWY